MVPKWRFRRAFRLTFLVAAIAVWGASFVWSDSSAKKVLSALQNYLGEKVKNPAKGGKVISKITYADEESLAQGKLKEVFIESRPAAIGRDENPLTEFRLCVTDAVFDVKQLLSKGELVTISKASASVYASITADQFTEVFAKGTDTKKMNLKVRFEDDKVRITGNWKLFLFKGPIEVVGTFFIEKEHGLSIDIEELKMNGVSAPERVIQVFEKKINPLLDSHELPFAPPIRSVWFEGNKLVVSSEKKEPRNKAKEEKPKS